MEEKKKLTLKIKPKSGGNSGCMALFYGSAGAGKTISSCINKNKTLFVTYKYDPTRHLKTMGFDISKTDVVDIHGSGIEGYADMKELFFNPDTYEGYGTVIFDDVTLLFKEVLDEISEGTKLKDKDASILLQESAKDMSDYQVVYDQIVRFTRGIADLAVRLPIFFIFNCHVNPDYGKKKAGEGRNTKLIADPNADFDIAPDFGNQKTTRIVSGFFDIVGYVKASDDDDPRPRVYFKKTKDYMAKWRGKSEFTEKPHRFVLDEILERSFGEKGKQ